MGGFRASLWLYGHRVGLRDVPPKSGKNYRFVWNDAWGPMDPAVNIADDVQQVWRTDAFNPRAFDALKTDILDWKDSSGRRKVEPNGWTPLYRSIVRAIDEDLANADRSAPRRLIVLTDGVDQVFDATGTNGDLKFSAPRNSMRPDDFKAAVKPAVGSQSGIQLTVVLYNPNRSTQ